jgi:hypothetical protein
MPHVGFRYTVEWHTEYSEPPEGLPRIKAEVFESLEKRNARMAEGGPSVPSALEALHTIGDGYCVTIQAVVTPSRQLPPATLAGIRKKRTQRRIEKKYPMFAEQFIEEAVVNNPSYFSGQTRKDLQKEHDAEIIREQEFYNRYLAEIEKGEGLKLPA